MGIGGMRLADCVMKNLCLRRGEAKAEGAELKEETVEQMRGCVQQVCPLSRLLPSKSCQKSYLVAA